MDILVTGATGRVGGATVSRLVRAGASVRALSRKPDDARLPGAVYGDLSDADSLDAALDGVGVVFLVFPTLDADHAAPEVVAKLAGSGRRIVYLSAAGVGEEPAEGIMGSHTLLERLVAESAAEWTFLRPSGFASNTLMWADQIQAGDVVQGFHGAASRALIHEDDIAAVAARALLEDGHAGAKYHLTGPARLTQVEQVHAIGEAIGRPLVFEELPPEVARRELFADLPEEMAMGIIEGHAQMITNPEPVTTTVADLTGAPARTYRRWAVDHAGDFGAGDGNRTRVASLED